MIKKIIGFLGTFFLLCSCSYNNKATITYDQIEQKILNQESFVYYIEKENCSFCKKLENNINSIKDIMVFSIDLHSLDDIQYQKELDKVNYIIPIDFFDENGYIYHLESLYTPTIFKYYKGKLVYSFIGTLTKDQIKTLFNFNLINIEYFDTFLEFVDANYEFEIVFYDSDDGDTKSKISNIEKELIDKNESIFYLEYKNMKRSQIDSVRNNYTDNIIESTENYIRLKF